MTTLAPAPPSTRLRVRAVGVGPDALVALDEEIVRAQAGDPLSPVTVVVPREAVGLSARRRLAARTDGPRGDRGLCNVRFCTLGHLAEQLGTARLVAAGRLPLTDVARLVALRAALAAQPDAALFTVRDHPSTQRALVATSHELWRCPPATLARLATQSARAAEVVATVAAARPLVGDFFDETDVLEAARRHATEEPTTTADLLGSVVVYLPEDLDREGEGLLDALGRITPVSVVLGACGDEAADQGARAQWARLAPGRPWAAPAPVPRVIRVVRAPSADAEVLTTVRALAEQLDAGTPLEAMAVGYAGPGPYPRLIREALDRAGLPWSGAGLRPLSATVPGRALLGWVDLVERDFRQEDLLAWLAGVPLRHRGRPVPATEWSLVARAVGPIEGADSWSERLAALAGAIAGGSRGGVLPPALRRVGSAERCHELARFLSDLASRTRPKRPNWAGWAGWAATVVERCLGGPSARTGWPAAEVQALSAVHEALDRLAVLDRVDGPAGDQPVGLGAFRSALAAELAGSAPQTSRFGRGVFVGRVAELTGLSFELVCLVGMHDGAFPAPRPDDPLLPDRERAVAEVARRAGVPGQDRRDYLGALAAAPVSVLSFAEAEQGDGRSQRPSPWLLEALGELVGGDRSSPTRLWAGDLDRLEQVTGFRRLASYTAAVRAAGEPASLADRDLRSLLVHAETTGGLLGHPLVATEPVLAGGLRTRRERRGRHFTRFDGYLEALAVPSPFDGPPQSPTRLEHYAACPRRYFLSTALGVATDEPPPERGGLSPAEHGALVHQVLERFAAAELAEAEPSAAVPAAGHRMAQAAAGVFADWESAGRAPPGLWWTLERRRVVADLEGFVAEDRRWRAERGLVPRAVELSFGGPSRPVAVPLANGRRVAVRGTIDRVDVSAEGSAVVVDYKTGSRRRFEDLATDPVAGGTKLQLAIYALAATQLLGLPTAHAAYWFVGTGERRGYDVNEGVTARLGAVVGTLVGGIESGLFPGRPGEDSFFDFENCRYCPYTALCPSDRGPAWERVRHSAPLAEYVGLAEPAEGAP